MKILTWNMDYWKRNSEQRKLAWNYLTNVLNPDISLIQEIVPPKNSYNEINVLYHEIDGKRKWGTAIFSKYRIHKELYINNGYVGARGTIIAEIKISDSFSITIVNIYGQIDSNGYATTTMHHLLSDLTTILNHKGKRNIILGGDFNVSEQFDEKYKGQFPSHKLMFDRIENFGLVNCTKQFYGGYIQTHKHSRSDYPWQNDYMFVSENIIERITKCKVMNEREILDLSDHLPLLIELKKC